MQSQIYIKQTPGLTSQRLSRDATNRQLVRQLSTKLDIFFAEEKDIMKNVIYYVLMQVRFCVSKWQSRVGHAARYVPLSASSIYTHTKYRRPY